MTDVTSFEDLTPKDIEKHMADTEWGTRLEALVDRFLEDSGEEDKKNAYALISMFVQTGFLNATLEGVQQEAMDVYQLAASLREDLRYHGIRTKYTEHWDGIVKTLKANVKETDSR